MRSFFRIVFEPELGGDDDLPAKRLKGFTDKVFVRKGTVDFCRIEEGDAPVSRRVQEPPRLRPGLLRQAIFRR